LNKDLKRKSSLTQVVHETFFSLNIGFSVTFAALAFAYGGQAPRISARYFFLPGEHLFVGQAAKINQFMHLDRGSDTGREIASCASMLLIALAVFLIILFIARTTLGRPVLYGLGGLGALALLPLLWLYILQTTWTVGDEHLYPFWRSAPLSFFAVEVPLVCAFFFLARHWRYQVWVGSLVLLLHYTLWTGVVWWIFFRVPLWSPKLFYIVFPGSGFAWLFYSRRDDRWLTN
jgi:hypothetical protein